MKIAIIGAGKLGIKIAESLSSSNHQITIVDINPAVIQKINNQMDIMAIYENGLDLEFYREIDIKSYDFLIALTDYDEKNILITALVKKMGCKKVIARVRDPEYMDELEFIKHSLDIDAIINPDRIISYEIFRHLMHRYKDCNEFFTGGSIGMMEIAADSIPKLLDKTILEASKVLPNVLFVAISRKSQVIIPKSQVEILAGDIIYVLGKKQDLVGLTGIIKENDAATGIEKVMIMGGGKTGYYLSSLLSKANVAVKIIEKDLRRCEYLSQQLDDVLVLHGDATDTALLEEENISGMDAFVTATGYDEDNLLLALMGKQYGVKESIAKLSKKSYQNIPEKLGIDMTLNTLDITASSILRIIQGSDFISASFFLQGQAEVIELIAQKNMRITGRHLRDIEFPEGVLIALIIRDNNAIIPDGETQIMDQDHVVIFCMLSDVEALEKLLQSNKYTFFRI